MKRIALLFCVAAIVCGSWVLVTLMQGLFR